MTVLPAGAARVPNLLSSRMALLTINRANAELVSLQQQIATGRSILRPSDDVVKSAAIGVLDDRLELSQQRLRNLSHATAALGVLDNALAEATDIAQRARTIASEQVNLTASAEERRGQASVVEEMLRGLFGVANTEGVAGYTFGASTPTRRPVEDFFGFYRFTAEGPGLMTDLGLASAVPITLGAGNAVVGVSGRVRGSVDLNPALTGATRLADLGGARGLGVTTGAVSFSVGGDDPVRVDLAGADSVDDVIVRLTSAIRAYEAESGTTVLGPLGIRVSGEGLSLDLPTGGPSVEFFEDGDGVTGRDLGLVRTPAAAFSSTDSSTASLAPRLTWRSSIQSLTGVTGALGSIRVTNAGRSATVDLSAAQTLQDVRNAIESANLGVRVRINASGTGIDLLSDVAGGERGSMSVEEVAGGNLTATRLGIRSLTGATRLSDFNFGRGVSIVHGVNNPTTGLPDPTLNTDLRIVLGNSAQTAITIDLRPEDVTTVDALAAAVNGQIQTQLAAAGLPSTALSMELSSTSNGLVLRQDPSFGQALRVEPLNNSGAAEHLGLLRGRYDPASASLIGEDRAKVRVDGLFSDLIDLRDSLSGNSVTGIQFASDGMRSSLERLLSDRGRVGSYGQRVDQTQVREEDRTNVDEQIRSELRDTDLAAAASRLTLVQTQLQAALQTTALLQSRTLLDFLG